MDILQSLIVGGIDFARFCRGFHAKEIHAGELSWSYIERSNRKSKSKRRAAAAAATSETVVFLHGFSSSKEAWVNMAAKISKRYPILIPDLPGQGRTVPAEVDCDYSMAEQSRRLNDFLEATLQKDTKIHLIGCSMGGLLAGMYAALYADKVASLTLLCPAGITMPTKSYACQLLDDTGKNLLLAKSPDDLIEMMQFIEYEPMRIPRVVATLIANQREKQHPVYVKILNDALAKRTILEDHLHLITAKTLVFWGKNDHILSVSSVPIMQDKLVNVPDKHFFVFDECGHTVQHEKVDECATAINAFLKGDVPLVYMKEKKGNADLSLAQTLRPVVCGAPRM